MFNEDFLKQSKKTKRNNPNLSKRRILKSIWKYAATQRRIFLRNLLVNYLERAMELVNWLVGSPL